MEIDITRFFSEAEPFEFSASIAERGQNAGPETWRNALREGESAPLLTTEAQLDALRDFMRGYGAWEAEEIDNWTAVECNALLVQLVSGDMREAGFDETDEPDWDAYYAQAEAGRVAGRMYRAADGKVFFSLSD